MKNFSNSFYSVVNEIVKKYPDYDKAIYGHVFQALEFACKRLNKQPGQHLSGEDLVVQGVVPLGIHQWGFLASCVFQFWGVEEGSDIGKVVARLIEFKKLKQDSNDRFEEFASSNLKQILAETLQKENLKQ